MQEWSSDWEVDAEIKQGIVELESYVGNWAKFNDWERAQRSDRDPTGLGLLAKDDPSRPPQGGEEAT